MDGLTDGRHKIMLKLKQYQVRKSHAQHKWLHPGRKLIYQPYCQGINWRIMEYDFGHSHKKRKHRLEGNMDWVLFLAKLAFSKILVFRLLQHTSNVNTECAGKSKQLHVNLFLIDDVWCKLSQHTSNVNTECTGKSKQLHINLFLIDDAWCKLCNIWLLLCENNSRGKYCCSYYSRQGDTWQFEKAN